MNWDIGKGAIGFFVAFTIMWFVFWSIFVQPYSEITIKPFWIGIVIGGVGGFLSLIVFAIMFMAGWGVG